VNRFLAILLILSGLTVAGLLATGSAGAADEADSGTASPAPASQASPDPNAVTKAKTSSGGAKRSREKEAEGTEARDRFKADTVIKSKYKLDGEPLEVDPD
jgi:hypothetical protein